VLEDYQRELKELATRYPSLVRPFTLKEKTFQGRDLQVIEIAENVNDGDDGRPVLFLNGIHHAREWPATESMMEFAWDLVQNRGKDARIDRILRDVRVLVMPFTNTDGFVVSRAATDPEPDAELAGLYQTATGVVLLGGSLSYKRKNCNPLVPIPAFPCELAIGVDNNRNYGEGWGGPGASSNPNDQGYRGPAPNSEPETRAVQELQLQTNSTVLLSMHNVAAKVLRPPGLEEDGFAPDEAGLKALGKKIADATGYANEYGWQLYDTTGTTKDWVYASTGAFGYTVELGGTNFHGSYDVHVVEQYVGQPKKGGLREGYLAAAEAARDPRQTSRISGRAPAGRTLRLTKAYKTETSPVCAVVDPEPLGVTGDAFYCLGPGAVQTVDEKLDITMKVPSSGEFEWWVNPSTRPFVLKKGGRETYTLSCEDGGRVVSSEQVFVLRGDVARVELPCGTKLPKFTVRVGALKLVRRTARTRAEVRGGSLKAVTLALLDRRGRTLATTRVASLTKARKVALKLRSGARVRPGRYRVRVTGTRFDGSRYRAP
jgi:Zinc carboxypeptidase